MAEQKVVFDDVGNGRYLILSDQAQNFPTERMRVKSATMRTPNGGGKPYPVLTLEGETSGNEFQVSCFSRDVKKCVQEWGNDPTSWQFITFQQVEGSNRRTIVPCENQNPEEE